MRDRLAHIIELTFRRSRKYVLHADKITLCALRLFPSQASVTSTKSSSERRYSNDEMILFWKLFQRRQNCWSAILNLKRTKAYQLEVMPCY